MSGDGTLAEVAVPIAAGTPVGTPIILRFQNVRLIGPTGAVLTGYNVVNDTLMVAGGTDIASSPASNMAATVFPNPGKDEVTVVASVKSGEVRITDAVGRTIWRETLEPSALGSQRTLATAALARGVYLFHIMGVDGKVVQTVKWVRE
jgi:hypothetical protein